MPQQTNSQEKLNDQCALQQTATDRPAPQKKVLLLSLIFLIAFGVRLVNWQTKRSEVAVVQSSVVLNYKQQARLIKDNGLASLYDRAAPTNDPDLLGHPLGYPILLSFIYRLASDSDTATQLLQMILDSLSALIIAMIAFEMFRLQVGVIAGLLAALAPQFSWNSMLLLPDTLAAFPILLAILLVARFLRANHVNRKQWVWLAVAGILLGLSCWLRANSLLLAPFFALLILFTGKRRQRWLPALIVVACAFLTIAPLTIRNAIVFREFIPVSLGAGQTLIEGIGDYDYEKILGQPQTDDELIRGEAETYQRPEYANSLFTPDGPVRDRARMSRGFAVIRAHPIWFGTVMLRRAVSMLKLERTPLRLDTASSVSSPIVEWPLRTIQRWFITVLFLPLSLLGAGFLIFRKHLRELAILLTVPAYYFCVQSALHTEYRYVLVLHYFLFVLAACAIFTITCRIKSRLSGAAA